MSRFSFLRLSVPGSKRSHTARPAVSERLESRQLLTVVLPGGSVAVSGTTLAARPALAGTVIYDKLIPFTVTNSGGTVIFKGDLQDRVVKENGLGTLDFYQAIISSTGSPNAILTSVARTTFTTFLTDVDYRTDGLGTPADHPTNVTRSAAGNLVTFVYKPSVSIASGQRTLFYFVRTNATHFTVNGITNITFLASPAAGITASTRLVTAEPTGKPFIPGQIGGTVVNDTNANGRMDAGEHGLPKVMVFLDLNHDGKLDDGEPMTMTNANGQYMFANLVPGAYKVEEVVPHGFRSTTPTGVFSNVQVTAGNTTTVNFEDTNSVVISGRVLLDTNGSHKPSAADPGLVGWRVYLDTNHDGKFESTEPSTFTDAAGDYEFIEPAGSYVVRIVPFGGFSNPVFPTAQDYTITASGGATESDLDFVVEALT